MRSLLAALQFLTALPPLIRRPLTPAELGRATGWYPLVGLALGALLWAMAFLLGLILPGGVVAVFVLAAWLGLTRALHFDGFLDTCDGLFGAFTPERRLQIMRDPQVGAFGLAGGVLLLLARYAAIVALPQRTVALLLAPVAGRLSMTLAIAALPYGRAEGLGRDVKDNARWVEAGLAAVTALFAAVLLARWKGLAALAFGVLVALALALFILRRIPGLTGDSYGAICETVETVILVVFTLEGVW